MLKRGSEVTQATEGRRRLRQEPTCAAALEPCVSYQPHLVPTPCFRHCFGGLRLSEGPKPAYCPPSLTILQAMSPANVGTLSSTWFPVGLADSRRVTWPSDVSHHSTR